MVKSLLLVVGWTIESGSVGIKMSIISACHRLQSQEANSSGFLSSRGGHVSVPSHTMAVIITTLSLQYIQSKINWVLLVISTGSTGLVFCWIRNTRNTSLAALCIRYMAILGKCGRMCTRIIQLVVPLLYMVDNKCLASASCLPMLCSCQKWYIMVLPCLSAWKQRRPTSLASM